MPEKNEVQILFEEHAPGVSADFVRQRGLIDPLSSPVVIAAEVAVAAFPFLWKVFMAWLERHTNGKVTIKYKADENVEITVEQRRHFVLHACHLPTFVRGRIEQGPQTFCNRFARTENPRTHRANRAFHDVGDLLVAQPLELAQHDGGSQFLG